jgi:pyrroloquinoline quinone biosynthesis protein B
MRISLLFLLGPLFALTLGCRSTGGAVVEVVPSPYVLLLGTAQDAGLPQIACRCSACEDARHDARAARSPSSLLLVDPASGRRWLFDATPALPAQLELARGHGGPSAAVPGRPALFDGIFLTHAHIGHYTGLMYLGREAYGSRSTDVHVTPRLARFFEENGPWDQLLEQGRVELLRMEPGGRVDLGGRLSVESIRVPHRDEYSDTVAYRIIGPERSVLYLPDIDKWERWECSLTEELERVDLALIDGTFYSGAELPGRDMSEIPHPFIVETLALLAEQAPFLRERVVFTHLNHSNPVADPSSAEAAAVRASGASVAREGDRYEL